MSEYMLNNKTTNNRIDEDNFKAKDERLINMSREKLVLIKIFTL